MSRPDQNPQLVVVSDDAVSIHIPSLSLSDAEISAFCDGIAPHDAAADIQPHEEAWFADQSWMGPEAELEPGALRE